MRSKIKSEKGGKTIYIMKVAANIMITYVLRIRHGTCSEWSTTEK